MKLKSEALRQSILSATSELVITQGIDATSTVRVAKKLKISQSNIYSYYKSKEALLLAVFKQHQAQLIAALRSATPSSENPLEQIDGTVRGLLSFAIKQPMTIQIVLLFRQHPQMRQVLPTIYEDEYFANLFVQIQQYQDQHIIRPYNAEFLAEGVFSFVVNYLLFMASDNAPEPPITQNAVIDLVHGFLLEPNQ